MIEPDNNEIFCKEWRNLINSIELVSKSGVYIIKNKSNDKKYVGQSKDLKSRLIKYAYARKSYRRSCCNQVIDKTLMKYNADNFEIDIIYCNPDDLDDLEIKTIQVLNTMVPNGYNIESGGNRNKIISQHTKELLRQANLGKKLTVTIKEKISLGSKARQDNYVHNLKGTGILVIYSEKRKSFRTHFNGNNYERVINTKRNELEAFVDVFVHRILIEVQDDLQIPYPRKNRSKYK